MNIQTDQTPNKNTNLGQAPLVDTQQVAKKYFPKVVVMYEKATNVLHLIWLVNQRCWFNFWFNRINLPRYAKQILQRFQSNRKLNWSPAPPISVLRKTGAGSGKKTKLHPNTEIGGWGVAGWKQDWPQPFLKCCNISFVYGIWTDGVSKQHHLRCDWITKLSFCGGILFCPNFCAGINSHKCLFCGGILFCPNFCGGTINVGS